MITPISLENDINTIRSQVQLVKKVGAKRFHVDIIDGLFADNITVSPADLQQIDFGNVGLDLHLLVDDPVEWIEECVAIKPDRILAQIERMGNIEYYIKTLRGYENVRVGLALDITTAIDSLDGQTLEMVDSMLLMSVKAGYSGQKFDPIVIERIKELRAKYKGPIVIDGGITPVTYKQVLAAGASEAGANSALWKGNFEENLRKFAEVKE